MMHKKAQLCETKYREHIIGPNLSPKKIKQLHAFIQVHAKRDALMLQIFVGQLIYRNNSEYRNQSQAQVTLGNSTVLS